MNSGGRLCSTFLCLCQSRPSTRSLVTVTRNINGIANTLSATKFLERNSARNHPLIIQRANKNLGRTVRKAINVYMPGDKVPSVKDQKNVKVVADDRLYKAPEALDIFNEVMLEATKNVKQRKFIVCEGIRLVEEAFKANLKVHKLFLQKSIKEVPERLKNFVEEQKVPVHHVSQTAIKNWSSLTTPPGVVGVFLKPKPGEIGMVNELKTGMPVTVICDNLREPGNLGSILRSAAGVGCKRVLLSKGCCDPWDEKVLRAGCGAQFRLPITMNYPLYSLVDCMEIENSGYDCRVDDTSQRDEEKPSGNSECKERRTSSIDNKDTIDGSKVENGNGKISSSRTSSTTGPSSQVESFPGRGIEGKSFALFLADSNDDMETDERKTLPVVSYADVDYTAFENVYLVVGGETEGLSRDILQITSSIQTLHPQLVKATVARLRIPLYNEIDSLNASNAFVVIAYEMLRQFHLKHS